MSCTIRWGSMRRVMDTPDNQKRRAQEKLEEMQLEAGLRERGVEVTVEFDPDMDSEAHVFVPGGKNILSLDLFHPDLPDLDVFAELVKAGGL